MELMISQICLTGPGEFSGKLYAWYDYILIVNLYLHEWQYGCNMVTLVTLLPQVYCLLYVFDIPSK